MPKAIPMRRYLSIGRAHGSVTDVARLYSVAKTTVYRARRLAEATDAAAALADFKSQGGATLDEVRAEIETKH